MEALIQTRAILFTAFVVGWIIAFPLILFSSDQPAAQGSDDLAAREWEFVYNQENILSDIRLPDGTALNVTTVSSGAKPEVAARTVFSHKGQTLEAYEWDSHGRIAAVESGGQRIRYSYDDIGRLASAVHEAVSESKQSQEKPLQGILYSWDNSSRLVEVRVDQDYWTKYGYDVLGRVNKVESPLGSIDYTYTTEKGHDIISREMTNGVKSRWTFDPMNRPIEVVHADQKNSVIFQETREYNPDNTIRGTVEWTRETGPVRVSYAYDGMGRLATFNRMRASAPASGELYEFKYDTQGNLLERRLNGQRKDFYEYSALGSLKSINGKPCINDRLGFPLEVPSPEGVISHRYDAVGRITSVTQAGLSAQFAHDVFGKPHTIETKGQRLPLVHDALASGSRPLITGGLRTEHYWSGAEPVGFRDRKDARLYLTDISGTVRALTDRSGNVTDYLEYSPDGHVLKGPKVLSVPVIPIRDGQLLDTLTNREIPSLALGTPRIAPSVMDLNRRLSEMRTEQLHQPSPPVPDKPVMTLPSPALQPFARELASALVERFKWDMASWVAQEVASNPSYSPRLQGLARKADLVANWAPIAQDTYEVWKRYSSDQSGDVHTHTRAASLGFSLLEKITGASWASAAGAIIGSYAELASSLRSTVLHERAKDLIRLPAALSARVHDVSESVDVDSGRYELQGERMYATASWRTTHERFQPPKYEAQARYGWERSYSDGARFGTEKVSATATETRTGSSGGIFRQLFQDEYFQRTRNVSVRTNESYSGDAFNKAYEAYEKTGKWDPGRFAQLEPGQNQPPKDFNQSVPNIPVPKYRHADDRLKKPDSYAKPFDSPGEPPSPPAVIDDHDSGRGSGLLLVSDRGIEQYTKSYDKHNFMLKDHFVFELPSARKNNPTYQQSEAVVEQRAHAAAKDYFSRHPGARDIEIRLLQDVSMAGYAFGGDAQDRADRYTAAFYRGLGRAAQESGREVGTLAGSNAGRTHSYAIQALAAEGKKATSFIVYNDAQVKREVVDKVIPLVGASNVLCLCERSGFHGSLESWGIPGFLYSRGDLIANPRVAAELSRKHGIKAFLVDPPGANLPLYSHTIAFDHSLEPIVDRQYNPRTDAWESVGGQTPGNITLSMSASRGCIGPSAVVSGHSGVAPANVGGVWLRGASKHLRGLGRVRGIAQDENGRLILLSDTGTDMDLGGLRLDDVVTIFRSVFEHGEAPFVSIDPVPENPKGPVMNIRHGQGTAFSYSGWILYETDRVMKALGLGFDNLTREKISCSVEGYKNQFHKDFFGNGTTSEVWERFWIVPASAHRRIWEKDGTRLALLDVPLEVRTQRMKMVKGKLEPAANEPPMEGADYFAKWFTSHYDDIGRQWTSIPPDGNGVMDKKPVKIFEALRQIALIAAIAEYMYEQGTPMPTWMRDYPPQPFAMPTQTPSLLVEGRLEQGNKVFTQTVYGGVNLTPETEKVTTQKGDKEAKELGEKLTQTFQRQSPSLLRPVEIEMPGGGKKLERLTALTIPGAEMKTPGCFEIANDDLVVMAGDQHPVRLTRRFNSFNLPSGEFGKGWTMGLPRLEKSKQVISKVGDSVRSRTVYNLYSPMGEVNAVFAKEREVKGRGIFLVDDHFEEALGLATMEDKRIGAKSDVVEFRDGRQWYFDSNGAFVGDCQGQFLVVYVRDKKGRIFQIAGFNGEACVADIRLAYDDHDRVQLARNNDGKAARYSYTENGELRFIETCEYAPEDLKKASTSFKPQGRMDYAYQNGLLKSIALNGKMIRSIEYDEFGRVKKMENIGDATGVHQYEYRALEGGKSEVAETGTGARTLHDHKMRPLIRVKQDGSLWEWGYPEKGGTNVSIHTAKGDTIKVTEDPARRNYTLTSTSGEKLEVSKSSDGAEVSLKKNAQTVGRTVVGADGRPIEYSDMNQRSHFEYDAMGALNRVTRTASVREGLERASNWIQTELDPRGRPTRVKTGFGDKLQIAFDDLDSPTQILDNERYLEIKRNPDRSVAQVKTNWGEEEKYDYNKNGDLTQYSATRDKGRFVVKLISPQDSRNNTGKSIEMADYRENKTRMEINEKEKYIRIQYPDQTQSRISFNLEKEEVVVENDQSLTRSLHDQNGNLVKLTQEAVSAK